MAIRSDVYQQLNDFRGILGWNSYTEPYSKKVIPHIEIPLYIKTSTVPQRKVSLTEVSTIHTVDPGTGFSTTVNVEFWGAPGLLQVEITGWTITPTTNSVFNPVDATGTPLGWGQLSYNDIILYFIRGAFNRSNAGSWIRKDPDYYTTPRGLQYTNPIISSFQPSPATVQKKQQFDMVLFLET